MKGLLVKWLPVLAAVIALLLVIPAARAAEVSGTCGENLTWVLTEDGTLTISGTGKMEDYAVLENRYAPWNGMREAVKRVIIENGVSSIGDYAFFECGKITDITIAESVVEIGQSAFSYCNGLTEITVPDGVTHIGEEAFAYCHQLTGIKLSENLTQISASMFHSSGLTAITIPASVTSIDRCAFTNCDALTGITIPEGVTNIGHSAFYHCGALASVTLPESLQNIEELAFKECTSLTDITIPKNVIRIGTFAFQECIGLTEVTICEGVTSIGPWAFGDCRGLTSLTIPASVTAVNAYAFQDCENLQEIRFLGDAPQFEYYTFKGDNLIVYYPAGASGWEEAIKLQHSGKVLWLPEENSLAAFVGTSVSLGDSLDIHFFLSDYVKESTDYAVITRSYADGRPDHVVTVPYSQWLALENGQLYITYFNVAAKEMNDTISLVICNKDGKNISEVYTDSVQDYAMRMLNTTQKNKLKTLLVDMLNYGAAAQRFFGYDTEHLANQELTPEQQAYATEEAGVTTHLSADHERAGTALSLKNNIRLDIFFPNSIVGTDYSELYAIIRYTNHYGTIEEWRIEGEEFVAASGNRVYVPIDGLSIADYAQPVSCMVYNAEGNRLAWVIDSIDGYIFRMQENLPDVVWAIAKFGRSAYLYFHNSAFSE